MPRCHTLVVFVENPNYKVVVTYKGETMHQEQEKKIRELFYQTYSMQCQEVAGEVIDGKVIVHFNNPYTDQSFAASLNNAGELVVEKR